MSALERATRSAEVLAAAVGSLRATLAAQVDRVASQRGVVRAALVVDDDGDYLEALAGELREVLAAPVWTARTAADARARWHLGHPALVVVDLALGGELGSELVRELIATEPAVVAVLISGGADPVTRGRAAGDCGAKEHRLKSAAGLAELCALVRTLLDAVCPPYWCRAEGGVLLEVSPDLTRLLGFDEGALDGTPWRGVLHPDDVRPSEAARDRTHGHGVVDHPQRWRDAAGGWVALRWSTAAHAGEGVYAVARID